MEYVQEFIKALCDAPVMSGYTCVQIFMDEDFKSAEHFTVSQNCVSRSTATSDTNVHTNRIVIGCYSIKIEFYSELDHVYPKFIPINNKNGLPILIQFSNFYVQALGNLYFVHQDVASLKLWNFLTHSWEEDLQVVKGKHIYSGNIETIATKEKSKFPQHFFPEVCMINKIIIQLESYSFFVPIVQVVPKRLYANTVGNKWNCYRSSQYSLIPRCIQPGSMRKLPLRLLQNPKKSLSSYH